MVTDLIAAPAYQSVWRTFVGEVERGDCMEYRQLYLASLAGEGVHRWGDVTQVKGIDGVKGGGHGPLPSARRPEIS